MILILNVGSEIQKKKKLLLSKNTFKKARKTFQNNYLLTPVFKDTRNASQKKFFQGTLALFYMMSRLIKSTVNAKHNHPYSLTNLSQHAPAKSSLQQLMIPKSVGTPMTCMVQLLLLIMIDLSGNISCIYSLTIQVYLKLHPKVSQKIHNARNVSVTQHYLLFQQLIYMYKARANTGRLILAL